MASILPDLIAQAQQRAKKNWRGLLVKLLDSDGLALLAQAQVIKQQRQEQADLVAKAREVSEAAAADELSQLRARRGQ